MNRSLLVIGISALLLGTAACSKQEAAGTRAPDDTTGAPGTTMEPSTPSDTALPPAAPEATPPESTTEPGATPGAPTDQTTPPSDTTTPPPQ